MSDARKGLKKIMLASRQNLTKEEWEALRDDLGLFRSIYLLIDGIPFVIKEERNKQKIVVMFYICGWFRGEWLSNHFFSKYLRTIKKRASSKKELTEWYKLKKSLYGKKKADEWKAQQFYTYQSPTFPSFRSFQLHITKVAKSIEVIDYERFKTDSEIYKKAHPEYFRNDNEETKS